MEYLGYVIQFLILFLIVFLYYRLFALKGILKKKKKQRNNELPEVRLFIYKNKVDTKKVVYLKVAKQLTTFIAIDLALSVVLTFNLVTNIFARIGVCLLSLIITISLTYKLLGFYYKKKGLINDVQPQQDRK